MPIKIIDLTAETLPTDDDLLIIRDNLTGTTRKITRTALFLNPPLPASSITTAMVQDGAITKIKLGADAKIGVRTNVQSSPGTLTANVDNFEIQAVTNLNSAMTIANPVGTPVNGQGLMYRIKDNGTAQGLSYGSQFRPIGVTLPGATVAGKTYYINARWNAEALTWDVLGVARQA
jgi:hypothetical protein